MTEDVKRSSNPTMLIAALLIFLGAGWFASNYFSRPGPAVAAPLKSPANCDISRQSCTAIRGDVSITLDIQPHAVRSMVPLQYRVEVNGVKAEQVMLEMQGVEMFMGLNQTRLQADKANTSLFTGTGELGVCTTGEMTWRATVTVITSQGPIQTWFDFQAR